MSAGGHGLRLKDLAQDRDAFFRERALSTPLAVHEPPACQEMEFAVGRALADGEFFRDRRWSRRSQLGDEQEDLLLSGCGLGPARALQHLRGGLGTLGADGQRDDSTAGEVVVNGDRAAQECELLPGHGQARAHAFDEAAHLGRGGRGSGVQRLLLVWDAWSLVRDADRVSVVQDADYGALAVFMDQGLDDLPDDDVRDAAAALSPEVVCPCRKVAHALVEFGPA